MRVCEIKRVHCMFELRATLDISNTDISMYPLISKNIVLTHSVILFTHRPQTTDIPK